MTTTPWDAQGKARVALHEIVADPRYGPAALSNPQMMANLLKDLLPDSPRESRVLIAASDAGVPGMLQGKMAQGINWGTASRLAAGSFENRAALTPEACTWAVAVLGWALHLDVTAGVTEHGVLAGLWPIHGDGVLARQGDLVLLIHPAGGAFTDRLLDLLAVAARAGESGLRFTDLVSAEFDADASAAVTAAEQGPAVVAFGPAGGGTAVAVYGAGWAEVTTAHGAQRLTTGEPYGRLRCVLPSTLIKVRAGVQPVTGDDETDPYLRLADGVVRAVALLYAPAEIRAEAADLVAPAPQAPADSAGPNLGPAPVQAPPPAPAVAEAGPDQAQHLAEPYPDQIEAPEPEYHATRLELAVPAPPAGPVPPSIPDPYVAQAPPPVPDPYAAQAPRPVPQAAPPVSPPPDPYAAQPPPDPYAAQPPPPDPYAAQPPPDPYVFQVPPPGPGPAAGPSHGAPRTDFISIPLLADEAGGEVPQRDPLPLGAEPPDAKGLEVMPAEAEPVMAATAPRATADVPIPERRLLQGRFPERVRLGEEVSLLVRLGLQPGARLEAGLRPLAVPEAGLDVVLLLVESPGFTLHSPERAVLHVVPRQDSNWAGFELQAARQGVYTLQVEAFAGGTGLGGLAVQVSVDATARTGPSIERNSPTRVTPADPGEVSLLLSYDPAQQVYRYRLVDSGGYYAEEATSDRLLQPPGEAIEQLVVQLNMLARGQAPWNAATTRDWLQGQGIALWNSFVPQALQREFWQRRDRITQITIVSQGDPVPWELLYPLAPGQDAGFLIDQFPVARRRYGPRPPGRLELRAADLVLSGGGSPAAAPAEIAALHGLLHGGGLAARRIGDLPGLLRIFQQGDVGLLHFSCHNAFARGTPNASRILLGNQPFEPVFLEAHAGRFSAPLVFLNACRTDGQAPLYTTIEGWAASFLRAGAGAFIGSLWEVTDTSASTYAQEFYRAALGGHTLGESARRARDAIRDNPGDPTWLAYTLYGDSAATVSIHPPQTD